MVSRLLGNAGQGVRQGKIGQWRVRGNARGQLDGLGQSGARGHQVLRQTHALAVLRVVHAACEHHVGHAGCTNQLGHTHRATAAHEDAASALGQRVKSALVGHADVARAGQLQAASHHRAMQGCHHGYATLLDRVQGHMPTARVVDAFARIAFLEFGQIQTGAEMVALAMDHRGAGLRGQVLEHIAQSFDQGVVQRVAFGRAAQAHHGNSPLHGQRYTVGGCAFKNRVAGGSHRGGFRQT